MDHTRPPFSLPTRVTLTAAIMGLAGALLALALALRHAEAPRPLVPPLGSVPAYVPPPPLFSFLSGPDQPVLELSPENASLWDTSWVGTTFARAAGLEFDALLVDSAWEESMALSSIQYTVWLEDAYPLWSFPLGDRVKPKPPSTKMIKPKA